MTTETPLPIDQCKRCVAMPGRVQTNHKQSEVRPEALSQLEPICSSAWSDDAGEVHHSDTLLRCRDCRTCYVSQAHQDEGHSFMDPTSDETEDRRLTLTEARHWFSQPKQWTKGDPAAALEEIAATQEAATARLFSMIAEARSPNGEVLRHAVASVVEFDLERGDFARIRTGLLAPPDPVVRVETVAWLVRLGLERHWVGGAPSTRDKALTFLDGECMALARAMLDVIRQPARPIPDAKWRGTTHEFAATCIGKLAGIRKPFHAEVLDLLLSLLTDADGVVAAQAAKALAETEWIHYGKSQDALSERFTAWSSAHPANEAGRKLAAYFRKDVERRAAEKAKKRAR